jgi:hypothetical protein
MRKRIMRYFGPILADGARAGHPIEPQPLITAPKFGMRMFLQRGLDRFGGLPRATALEMRKR